MKLDDQQGMKLEQHLLMKKGIVEQQLLINREWS